MACLAACTSADLAAANAAQDKMKIQQLVLREISTSNQLIFCLLSITLGIAIIVGIKNNGIFGKAYTRLDVLGANILILPKSANVQDYSMIFKI
jgi:hypothetical protein